MAETTVGSALDAAQKGIKGPIPARVPLDRDVQQRADISKEFHLRHYPNVIFRALVRPDIDQLIACDDPDNEPIYIEDRSKTFGDGVLIPAQVNADPPQQLQQKFGLDEQRDVVFIFSTFILQELGLSILPGDEINHDGHRYEVQSTHRRDFWLNTGIPFHLSCECDRYREERT